MYCLASRRLYVKVNFFHKLGPCQTNKMITSMIWPSESAPCMDIELQNTSLLIPRRKASQLKLSHAVCLLGLQITGYAYFISVLDDSAQTQIYTSTTSSAHFKTPHSFVGFPSLSVSDLSLSLCARQDTYQWLYQSDQIELTWAVNSLWSAGEYYTPFFFVAVKPGENGNLLCEGSLAIFSLFPRGGPVHWPERSVLYLACPT
jgi:hypothetical protein